MRRRVFLLCVISLTVCAGVSADSTLRFKLSGDHTALSSNDVIQEQFDKSDLLQLQSNFRYMYETRDPRWSFEFHGVAHGLVSNVGYLQGQMVNPSQSNLQASGYWNLSKNLTSGRRHTASMFVDRLRLSYRSEDWRFMIGRLPVSWGRGIVYQPLDVFNAYPPTAIDREFKPGNDSLVLERLFNSGAELQFLSTFRNCDSTSSNDASTHVLKGYFHSGESEFDLILGQHWSETIGGISIASPLGPFLVRTDVVLTCGDFGSCTTSAVANMDYSFGVMGGLLYTFVEYFYNGFGVSSRHKKTANLPSRLLEGIQRGEIFAYGKHLIATGASVTWHPLWNQSVSLLINASDRSFLVQTNVSYVPTDNVNLALGFRILVGDTNEEFGATQLDNNTTSGGNSGLFFEFSYYR
ncbi:MAG: hypothetical protein F4X44_06565 [Gammaproteobacteria bacterium]|nr:hypothetical protein [Gammaproteobacteria bacterium]